MEIDNLVIATNLTQLACDTEKLEFSISHQAFLSFCAHVNGAQYSAAQSKAEMLTAHNGTCARQSSKASKGTLQRARV
jgi:hypothetical protein